MSSLPAGTVTFLFTDVEGSTRLLQQLGDGYADVARDHRRLLRETLGAAGGTEIDTQGDAFFFSFPRARDAVRGAVAAQRALRDHRWPHGVEVRVRMGLHTGEPTVGEDGYVGLDVVRAARIAAAGHGGQVLISETTRTLLGSELPDGVTLHDHGEVELKDIRHERIFELAVDGAPGSVASPAPAARRSAGEALAERIERQVEERLDTLELGDLGGSTFRVAAGGLAIAGLSLLVFAATVVVVILLVRLAF